MSMQPQDIPAIPQETLEVAQAAFPNGNLYIQMREQLGVIYQDHDFVELFSGRGQPAESPWRLVLVCIMQFIDNLSDRQAAEAVRARIDWKYALSLPLKDPGFNFSILSEFRSRLLASGKEQELLTMLLARLKEKGLLKSHRRQRTDSTHVLAAIRSLNRLELLGETFRAALNSLSVAHPGWLEPRMQEEWFERYGRRMENYRLPKLDNEREALTNTIGQDGFTLLDAVYAPSAPDWLRQLPAVETLRQVWIQQFYPPGDDGSVQGRSVKDMPPSGQSTHSPHDVEARYSKKRNTEWVGYKAHLSEICDPGSPRLIVNVHTTSAGVADDQVMNDIHQALKQKQVLPDEHFLDGGYTSAEYLVHSKSHYGIDIIGPVQKDHSWQAKSEEAFDVTHFTINWEEKFVVCPQGNASTKWHPDQDARGKDVIKARFLGKTCRACPVRAQCTRSKAQPRELTFRPQELFVALNQRRQIQETKEFQKEYRARAGIESSHSQATRRSGLRRTRYIGLAKTHLQHVLTAIAINFVRLDAWFNDIPIAKTRVSRFKRELQPTVT